MLNWLRRALGGKADSGPADQPMIRAYNEAGQPIYMDRDKYRKTVLPDQFRRMTNDPDALYNLIVITLGDEFFEDAIAPARRLLAIDGDRERATTVLGISLMRSGRLDEAEQLLDAYLREVGPSGVVLTNLAKVHAQRGESGRAEEILWQALECDPNQDNGLVWWATLQRERSGEAGYLEALRRVSELPGSWRAQLWLARHLLESGQTESALATYRSTLPAAAAFGDALGMISGDLGNHGLSRESLEIVGSVYDSARHGTQAGYNLIQSCLEIGDRRRGRELLAKVEQMKHPEWMEPLARLRHALEA